MTEPERIATEPFDASQPVLFRYTDAACARERERILEAAPAVLGRAGAGEALEGDRRLRDVLQSAWEFVPDPDQAEPALGRAGSRGAAGAPRPGRPEPDIALLIDDLQQLLEEHTWTFAAR